MGYTNPVSDVECDDVRQQLADYAKTFEGCHYLWGGAGNRPGKMDGAPYRRGAVVLAKSNLEPSTVSIFAALCNVGMGDYTCAGNYNDEGWKEDGYGGESSPTDPALKTYLKTLKDPDGKPTPEPHWASADKGYPRLVQRSGGKGKIVWGEDCRMKPHFDCIGFINYVYITKVQGFGPDDLNTTDANEKEKGHNGIPNWASGGAVGGAQFVVAKPPDDNPDTSYDGVSESLLKPADVLIQRAFITVTEPDMETGEDGQQRQKTDSKTGKPVTKPKVGPDGKVVKTISLHHIGMYAGGGKVIQANDSPVGVTLNNYNGKSWHYAVRLPCSKMVLRDDVPS